MVINTNVTAYNTSNLLANSTKSLSKSLARLSSGSKIIQPQDDAAGLAQVMRFEAQINRNYAVHSNLGNAVSLSQTQDGFLTNVQNSLTRMSELSMLAHDVTRTDTDRSNYSVEFQQLQNYISDIGTKEFNGVGIFGSAGNGVTIDSDAGLFTMNAVDLQSTTVGVGLASVYTSSTTSITNMSSAGSALSNIQTAIQSLADMRAKVGANIQRLNLTQNQVSILNENLETAKSRIVDVDVATESTQFARHQILVQSGTAMLAQANTLPQMALKLIL